MFAAPPSFKLQPDVSANYANDRSRAVASAEVDNVVYNLSNRRNSYRMPYYDEGDTIAFVYRFIDLLSDALSQRNTELFRYNLFEKLQVLHTEPSLLSRCFLSCLWCVERALLSIQLERNDESIQILNIIRNETSTSYFVQLAAVFHYDTMVNIGRKYVQKPMLIEQEKNKFSILQWFKRVSSDELYKNERVDTLLIKQPNFVSFMPEYQLNFTDLTTNKGQFTLMLAQACHQSVDISISDDPWIVLNARKVSIALLQALTLITAIAKKCNHYWTDIAPSLLLDMMIEPMPITNDDDNFPIIKRQQHNSELLLTIHLSSLIYARNRELLSSGLSTRFILDKVNQNYNEILNWFEIRFTK